MYDYAGGKSDWAVHGLPLEGRTASRRRTIDVARKDIPTCGPRERLGDVRDRVRAAGHDVCIVVDEREIVLGRLRRDCWDNEPDTTTEDCMELGPPTDRPDKFLTEVIDRLRKIGSLLITWTGRDEDGGRLIGVLYRADAERVLAENEQIPR